MRCNKKFRIITGFLHVFGSDYLGYCRFEYVLPDFKDIYQRGAEPCVGRISYSLTKRNIGDEKK